MPKEKLSDAQVALYAEKYLKMRIHSVQSMPVTLRSIHDLSKMYDARNDDILYKWLFRVQDESGINHCRSLPEVELNCLRYLAMREESCWHDLTDNFPKVRFSIKNLNTPTSVIKNKHIFDMLADNPKLYHTKEISLYL